jgi:hypothetical protein
MAPRDYEVSVSNTFEAESPQDALSQMVAWVADHAYQIGYRVVDAEDPSRCNVFIDAEDIDWNAFWDDK